MAINLKKIARDILHEDADVQSLALTTIVQLSSSSIEDTADLVVLAEQLEKAVALPNEDVVFLARKAQNHVKGLLSEVGLSPAGAPAGRPAPEAGGAPPPGIDPESLRKVLRSPSGDVELATAVSQMIAVGEPPDLELLRPLLKHADARVRSNAAEAVERVAEEKQTAELLAPLMADPNNRVRGTVAKILGRMGMPKISRYLEEMLSSPKVSMRESAVYALSHIRGADMVELLCRALRDPYEGIRLRAVRGLRIHGDSTALEKVRPLMQDVDINVCEEASKTLAVLRNQAVATAAGELLDLEVVAAIERERAAEEAPSPRDPESRDGVDFGDQPTPETAGESAANPSATAGVPTAGATLPDMPQTPGISPPRRSRKQTAQLLQSAADELLQGAQEPGRSAGAGLEGLTRDELEAALRHARHELGEAVFKLCRAGTLEDPRINITYYDILKFQEFLRQHLERSRSAGPQNEGKGLFAKLAGSLKSRKDGQQEDPVKRLQSRIEQCTIELGIAAAELSEQGEIDLGDAAHHCERIQAIQARL